ncbi:hypothetical protein C1H46_029849 [Malus baccata]|uniref:C2H2-type domain-containing protein n=1 Tax=Malus baccata TaxID=106549 RepID=A0A540LE82_MALBA|nr:hypothetical protein C1H46_029849 [Malus baccata]
MEKRCKICMRSFPNGRALGGHMRSHVMNHPIPPKPEDEDEEANREQTQLTIDELCDSASASSPSSSDDEEEHDDDMIYGLSENPKRSIKLVDPEFSFVIHAGSIVLQDKESETESSKNPTRRRSKRTRKSSMMALHHHQNHNQYHHHQKLESFKKIKLKNKVVSSKADSFDPEPVSSISDATKEEDVAFCLMMLSRDKWKKQDRHHQHEQEQEKDDEVERSTEDTDDSEEHLINLPRTRTARGKYKCETCNKVLKSYQALGGHRASHKKIMALNANPIYKPELEQENYNVAGNSSSVAERKIHECPVCFRVFSSGQALGGHKRSHVMSASTAEASNSSPPLKSLTKLGDSLIDLNLPAPFDDDDIGQIELSAVSDSEFVNHIRR